MIADSAEIPSTAPGRAVSTHDYLVVIEQGAQGWGAFAPDLPGLGVAGASEDEVRALIDEAVAFHIEGLIEEGLPVPQPRTRPYWVTTRVGTVDD
jgi:predicted RNase H-like HicB family nuclease